MRIATSENRFVGNNVRQKVVFKMRIATSENRFVGNYVRQRLKLNGLFTSEDGVSADETLSNLI